MNQMGIKLPCLAAGSGAIWFILDQFGVMHNGVLALPGASECYANLAASGKKIVILSNTSRRAANGGPCKT